MKVVADSKGDHKCNFVWSSVIYFKWVCSSRSKNRKRTRLQIALSTCATCVNILRKQRHDVIQETIAIMLYKDMKAG